MGTYSGSELYFVLGAAKNEKLPCFIIVISMLYQNFLALNEAYVE